MLIRNNTALTAEKNNRFLGKGLSLIEASMVLVLSAVVVAGVMTYYQTAQNNNNLDKFSAQIIHTVSTVNGLYLNAKQGADGRIYDGLTTETLLAADDSLHVSPTYPGTISTPFPSTLMEMETLITDPSDPSGYSSAASGNNRFAFSIVTPSHDPTFCAKFVAMQFGDQLENIIAFVSSNGAMLSPQKISPSAPLAEKVQLCHDLAQQVATTPGAFTALALVFK